jgi:hypothetical protein
MRTSNPERRGVGGLRVDGDGNGGAPALEDQRGSEEEGEVGGEKGEAVDSGEVREGNITNRPHSRRLYGIGGIRFQEYRHFQR